MIRRHMPLIEQVAATIGAYVAVQLVRRLYIEHQVKSAMRELERVTSA